jgi:hypothetical protein
MARGHWFVLLDFAGINDFWRSTALGFLTSLRRAPTSGKPQYQRCLEMIAKGPHFSDFSAKFSAVKKRLSERVAPTSAQRTELVSLFMNGLARKPDATDDISHRSVVRAYLQLLLGDPITKDAALYWLQGYESDPAILTQAGLPPLLDPHRLVAGTLWMLNLIQRTLIGVDQIDAIVSAQSLMSTETDAAMESLSKVRSIVQLMASGLMDLYDLPGRAKTVIACLEATWNVLKTQVSVPVTARFHEPLILRSISTSDAAMSVVQSRLLSAYKEFQFTPPYASWPIKPEAFESALNMGPRALLKACDSHRLRCRAARAVIELDSFAETRSPPPLSPPPISNLDTLYLSLRKSADVVNLLGESREEDLKRLLFDVLQVYADNLETPENVDVGLSQDKNVQRPLLHARLVFTFRSLGDRERHFCFRLLPHVNAVAFQARLRAAMTATGLDRALSFRHLIIVRRGNAPSGPKTATLVQEFQNAGGVTVDPTDDELRSMSALVLLKGEPGYREWIKAKRPFDDLQLFIKAGLHEAVKLDVPPPTGGGTARAEENPPPAAAGPPRVEQATPLPTTLPESKPPSIQQVKKEAASNKLPEVIPIGRRIEGGTEGREQTVPIAVLPRHTAILAGAGAGKTVLVRRLIEEAVLCGIPAVVLDSNNDLSTLGDAWLSPPNLWKEGDSEKAKAYHEQTEVVVWTPGLTRGRPITLDVLPDFGANGQLDADEESQAIDMALSTIGSLVKLNEIKRGVLADGLRAFARGGGGGLDAFVGLLGDLPLDASRIGKAQKVAADIANQLLAAISTNPLLRGEGPPLDPRALFTSDKPDRTRVSVISFVGLPSEESRQEFVNRLQMSLFTWIKREPSPRPRLYVVDEARNFMPSQKPAASKESAISLAAQARKYGLGLIVATQTPKDIDNRVISNCTTHFYGKMNSPAAIDTVREMMANKGGAAADIGALTSGTFYFSSEGISRPLKVKTAMCLSHHPANPPSNDEVIRRASR